MATHLVTELTQRLFPGTPPFSVRGDHGQHLLLGALAQPQWSHYRTLQIKAGVLHYCLNKDHPFVDGNKRFAVAAMDTFLFMNDAELIATDEEVTALALKVAKGELSQEQCAAFLQLRVLRYPWNRDQILSWLTRMPPNERTVMRDVLRSWEPGRTGRYYRIKRELAGIWRSINK